ncbi:MFS transporter [Agaribacterium haliotis]|uniref:MFS transporter n=1 Tax=Agaribacterium haliotis TaxID=2013869 RepID=UPI000BB585C7|nr:MFS transporter [Agaribacterium haliotis]
MPRFPLNIWVLALCFSLAMSGVALLVLVGALIGSSLAPSEKMASLPMALFVIGNASFSIPAAMAGRRWGRKRAAYCGFGLSLLSAIAASVAISSTSFAFFCIASSLCGCGTAFYHQFRFAALESLKNADDAGPALSLILLCSIVGSVLGPELGSLGRELLPGEPYSASFLLYALMLLLAMLIFSLFRNPEPNEPEQQQPARSLKQIAAQPLFIVAAGSAALAYAVMSFLMTSTPLSMHVVDGHSLEHAKNVIQAHMVAMFLPSLFSGFLLKKLGPAKLMLAGTALYGGVCIVGLSGQHVVHYWWALVLLGVGWNFLFLSGTALLPQSYHHSERFKAQALNDFSVFGLQAIASLSSAWVLFAIGWQAQLWLCLIPIAASLAMSLWLWRQPRAVSVNKR